MGKSNIVRDLGYLGTPFQYSLVKTFVEYPESYREVCHAVDQNMFTDANLKRFVGVYKEFYEKYDTTPSYDEMLTQLNAKATTDTERTFNEDLIKKLRDEVRLQNVAATKDLATQFFTQQKIVKACNQILSMVGNGETDRYSEIVGVFQDAMNVGKDDDMGVGVFDNIDETLSDDYRCPIPTGVDMMDKILEGGLGKGELGVIIGPSSFGKTSLTTAMAAHAAVHRCEANGYKGFKVVQIVFEDKVKQIQRKHLAHITGVEAKDLSKPDYIQSVKGAIDSYEDKELVKSNLIIKKFYSGEVGVAKIRAYLQKLVNMGFRPDLCIVDYFECLQLEKAQNASDKEYTREGLTMRRLETMADEMNMALWVPTQGNRESITSDIVTMDKSGGSIKKIQIGHIVVSISRSMEDIANNIATFSVLKNRAGSAGSVMKNVSFNNGTCRVSTENVETYSSMSTFTASKKEANMMDMQKRLMERQKNVHTNRNY